MNIQPLLPEIVLILMFFLIYIIASGNKDNELIYGIIQVAAAINVFIALYSYDQTGEYLNKIYVVDNFSQTFKVMIAAGYFLIVYMSTSVGKKEKLPFEYFQNLTIASFGLYLVASSGDIFTMLMSLEVTTLSLYVILFFKGSNGDATKAGIKYILISVVVSGLALYGVSLLWGATGKIMIKELAKKNVIPMMIGDSTLIVVSFILILSTVLFKIVVFPFHFSVEDITEKSNGITSSFIITVLVIGSTAALIKIVNITGNVSSKLTWFLITISVVSIVLSVFKTISQDKIRNFVAFSTINNCGFLLLSVVCNNETGLIASVYSVSCFSLIVMSLLYIVKFLEKDEALKIIDLKGLNKRSNLMGFTFAVSIAGIVGMPFTSGFIGKFLILYAAIQKEFYGIIAVYIFSSVISFIYAAKLIRNVYMGDSKGSTLQIQFPIRLLSVFFIIGIILPGVFPQIFVEYAKRSIIMLLSFGPL